MNEYLDNITIKGWMNEWMKEWMNTCLNEYKLDNITIKDEWMNEWKNEWIPV